MNQEQLLFSVVVIGQNEGKQLKECLESVQRMIPPVHNLFEIIYVDSGSTDNSRDIALSLGIKVLLVTSDHPNAAMARNVGWKEAKGEFVLFIDGDSILEREFVISALPFFEDPAVAIVVGNIKEKNPSDSIYNRVMDLDWRHLPGEIKACGGNAFIRRTTLEIVHGFDPLLIAGEDADICRRIRGLGYKIIKIDFPMVAHDLAMTRFGEYWKRGFRTGYAYAEVSRRYMDTDDPLWSYEYLVNWVNGGSLLVLIVWTLSAILLMHSILPFLVLLIILTLLALRTAAKPEWGEENITTRILYGFHSQLIKIPMVFGQLAYLWDRYKNKSK